MTAALRPSPRLLAASAAGTLAVLSAAGLVPYLLFDQASDLKWAMTVVGSCLLVMAATAREPLRPIVALAIVAAPFYNFNATFLGVEVSVLFPILGLGWVVAVLSREGSPGRSHLSIAAVWFVGLLAVPAVENGDVGTTVTLIATMIAMAWLVAQLTRRRGGVGIALGALAASAALQALIAIWQFHTGHQLNLYGGAGEAVFGNDYFFSFDDINRPTGGLDDPISLGNVLALGVPAAVYTALTIRSAMGRRGRVCRSRRHRVRADDLPVAHELVRGDCRRRGRRGAVAARAPDAGRARRRRVDGRDDPVAMAAGGQSLVDRFDTALAPTSRTSVTAEGDRTRLRLWDAGSRVALANPVAGVGFGGLHSELGQYGLDDGPLTHVHSTYLMLAACGGLLRGGGVARGARRDGGRSPPRTPGQSDRGQRVGGMSRRQPRRVDHGLDHRLSAGRSHVRCDFRSGGGPGAQSAAADEQLSRAHAEAVSRPDAHQQHHSRFAGRPQPLRA